MIVLRARRCFVQGIHAVLLGSAVLALASQSLAEAAEVTATRLDGTAVTGRLLGFKGDQVVVRDADEERSIPVTQLLTVRWRRSGESEKLGGGDRATVELRDGSLIPSKNVRVAGRSAIVTLPASGGGEGRTMELPTSALAAVRFKDFADELAAQWEEIRGQKISSDLLVIFKRDGKSLDYVEGVVGAISDEQIEFKLDGEANRVDRAKVAGIIYYRSERTTPSETLFFLEGESGLRADVAKARVSDEKMIEFTTTSGVEVQWPLDDCVVADFSGGKIQFLSDLEPASSDWSPLVSLPTGLSVATEYGQPRRDQSAFGGKLSVVERIPREDRAAQTVLREFDKGLALRSRTELVYRVPAGFARLRGVAGIDPSVATDGHVRLVISADDRDVSEIEVSGDGAAQPIDVALNGAKRLKIVVDFGNNQDRGDWLNFCDAKLIK